MAKLLLCFKPMRGADRDSEISDRSPDFAPQPPGSSDTQESHRTVAFVELLKHTTEPLGLKLGGGTDRDMPVHISALRPGGVAKKSGALQVGDHILGINGTATEHLTHSEVNALLENAGNVINLEIAFDAPAGSAIDDGTMKKVATITIPREKTSFGFTISGGRTENRPITVSNVTVGSAAYKNGFLKAGDRILSVNNVDVNGASQMETLSLLKTSEDVCTLEIEYDVTVHEGLSEANVPLLVKILKPRGASLGLSLRESPTPGDPLWISRLKEAGIADRCGALHIGDQLLSVNGVPLENKPISEIYHMLRHCDLHVELEIFPAHNLVADRLEAFSDSASHVSHLPSYSRLSGRQSQLSLVSTAPSTHQLISHPEIMLVCLKADSIGFGLSLQGGATDHFNYPLTISKIEEGGPAAKLGQLKVGDRVISINQVKMDGVTLQQALKLVQEAGNILDIEVGFDVNDAIVPSSGTFDVTLQKTDSLNLGITINGSNHPGDTIWISNLKKGGVASRMGTLRSGDVILAINDQGLENATLRDAAQMLKNAGDIIKLKVSKENVPHNQTETIIYSVELHRNNQPLGITLTGSREQGGSPIIISKIKEEGVAHKTGTLKAGDRILAINGENLFDKTMPEAVHLLNNAGDIVRLKISKATKRHRARSKAGSPTGKYRYGRDYRHGYGLRSHMITPMNRLSRTSSFGSSYSSSYGGGYLPGIRGRHLSQSTLATSASGRSTPDNHSLVSLEHPYSSPALLHNRGLLGRLTPSDVGSAFSRPTSSAYKGWYAPSEEQEEVTTPTMMEARLPSQFQEFEPQKKPSTGLSATKRDSSTETDEEMSLYEQESVRSKYRRTSLPVRPLPKQPTTSGKKWDFGNSRRSSYQYPRYPIPVGRVSPITPNSYRLTNSPYPKQLEGLSSADDEKTAVVMPTTNNADGETSVEAPPTKSKHEATCEENHVDHFNEDNDPDNGAKASGGSRSESKLSSSSHSEGRDSEEPPVVTSIPTTGGGESYTSPELVQTDKIDDDLSSQDQLQQEVVAGRESQLSEVATRESLVTGRESQLSGGKETAALDSQVDTEPYVAIETNTDIEKPVSPALNDDDTVEQETLPQNTSDSALHINSNTSNSSSITSGIAYNTSRRGSNSNTSTTKSQSQKTSLARTSVQAVASLQGFKHTMDKADQFEQAMKALAESGSSDPDSDSEPHGSRMEDCAPHEQQKIQDKMRTPLPPNQIKVKLKKNSGVASFGFSVADGQYDVGVYVKTVKTGGPADVAGGLLPFDRILKVNDVELQIEHNCTNVVPLLKKYRDEMTLVVARHLS